MNARRTLFLLITVAVLLLALSLTLAVRLQNVVAITNDLISAYSALNDWQVAVEQEGSASKQAQQAIARLQTFLPATLGVDDEPSQRFIHFFSEADVRVADPRVKDLEDILIWELFECHRLQSMFSFWVNLLQVALASVVLGIAVVAYFMGRRAQDYRLAPFPEANPNPVFGLNFRGEVIYTNQAARDTAEQYLGVGHVPVELLPDDFHERLDAVKDDGKEQDLWLHPVHEHIFQHRVHLLPSADRIHVYSEDITEQEQIRARNDFIASHDPVCLLANRQRLEHLVDQLHDPKTRLTLVLTFVTGNAPVMSTLGVAVVDKFAREFSLRLRVAYQSLREQGAQKPVVFRFDADLFGCLFFHELSAEAHQQLELALQQTVEQPFEHQQREFFFQVQSGVASAASTVSARSLIRKANLALHSLNGLERHYQVFDSDIESSIQSRAQIEQALRRAVDQNELMMVYQPQMNIGNNSLVGFEALMRWSNDGELISPGVFIPVAETTGLIHSLGHWAMRDVFRQLQQWTEELQADIGVIAVNVSVQEFTRTDFIEELEVALADYPIDCQRIQLEITESLLITDEQAAIDRMHQLKALGFTLAIDDFGTGYSSFSYLSRFPVDKLKIDRSFVVNMSRSTRDEALVAAMVNVAHQLGMTVIAEGVETEQELEILRRLGCDQVQGYLYGRPMPAAKAARFASGQTEVL